MSFIKNTTSFTRLHITDPVPADLWAKIPDKLRQFAFKDIDELAEERSWGWVCFDDMLDTHWHTAPPEKGEYITFSLRLDTRRIPPAVIKKHTAIAFKDEEHKLREQGKKYISRERKRELQDLVKLRLMARFLPIPAEFNVVWNRSNNTIYFASTQAKAVDLFISHFTLSFDLHLEPLTPYSLAAGMLDEQSMNHLDMLEATSFA